ncbi:MAG: PPC domain-containing protein [Alteraurantiacibacter sp.]
MRFGFTKTALLAGAAALLVPASAAAQDVRTLDGNIDGEAATFTVDIPAGTVMTIDTMATSADLDTIMTVTDAATGELLAEDDDGGEDLNSRVRIQGGPQGRRVTVSVDSFDAEWVEPGESYGGTFDLRLSTAAYTPPGPVTYGARETGRIDGEAQEYSFTARAGDTVEIALITEGELDPYLELRDMTGNVVAENDDGGDSLNSYIRHTFASAGTYTIAAMGFHDSTGDYTLRIRDRSAPIPAQESLQEIGLDAAMTGSLRGQWAEGESDLPTSIDYRLSRAAIAAIRRGDGNVTFDMTKGDAGDPDFGGGIDPYIQVGFDTPLGFAMVDEDDDGAGDLDARLPLALGVLDDHPNLLEMLRIRVQAFGGSGGSYTLRMTEGLLERMVMDDMGMMAAEAAMADAMEAEAEMLEEVD